MKDSNTVYAIDYESYFSKDYSLTDMSVHQYVTDPRFDAYLLAVHGESLHWVGHPKDFDWALIDGTTWIYHNMSFDHVVFKRLQELGIIPAHINPAAIYDTADMAAYLGSKRSLKDASKSLLGVDMSKAVRSNMKGRTYAEALEAGMGDELHEYGGGDARNTYDLWVKCNHLWPDCEKEMSRLNFESNQFGVMVDKQYVSECADKMELQLADVLKQLPWVANGEKPLSPKAVRKWGEASGIAVPASLAKTSDDWNAIIKERGEEFPWLKAIGTYRSLNAHLLKAKTIRDGLRSDGTCLFAIRYWGALTGRFSGGSGDEAGAKFNALNMPRKEMFGCDIRKFFVARTGKKLCAPDFSQIEARVLLWLAGDKALADAVRKEGNLYSAYAKMNGIFKGEGDFKKLQPLDYQAVKGQVLGLGYNMGAMRYAQTLIDAGLVKAEIEHGKALPSKDEVKRLLADIGYDGDYDKRTLTKIYGPLVYVYLRAIKEVDDYRRANPRIVNHWALHQAYLAKSAKAHDATHEVALRSGRVITYYDPQEIGGQWGGRSEYKARTEMGGTLYYLHGGILTNNEVQATARDIMCDAWRALVKAGVRVLWTIYDEIVCEIDDNNVEQQSDEILRIVLSSSPWAEGCPLGAESSIMDHYTK